MRGHFWTVKDDSNPNRTIGRRTEIQEERAQIHPQSVFNMFFPWYCDAASYVVNYLETSFLYDECYSTSDLLLCIYQCPNVEPSTQSSVYFNAFSLVPSSYHGMKDYTGGSSDYS